MRDRRKNRAKKLHEIEFEQSREASSAREAREKKLAIAKDKQIRKNRKNEWTVFWRGGAPQ